MIVKRNIRQAIEKLITKYPILALTGPRQSGKTTLLKAMFPSYEYISLENPDYREFAENDPNGFLKRYSSYVIFDEVQRIPLLFSYLQSFVDQHGIMGQFVLSGSQNFHLMQSITQSLAGRVAIFKLFPFDIQELKSASLLAENYTELLVKGFYPAIYDRGIPSKSFYSNYLQTYIQRDVSELIAIRDMRLFQNFIGLCATNAGQLLNLSALANKCGISQPTAKAWLSALENSYVIFQLSPFHENFSKRIVKTPKLYFYDTGLLCYLLKLHNPEQIAAHPVKGSLFENMMIAEFFKQTEHNNDLPEAWFWRDAAGHEIDLLIQDGFTLRLFEIKATQTITSDAFKGFNYFEKMNDKYLLQKALLYTGHDKQARKNGEVIPWKNFIEP
jgi:uncharacterized protein